MRKTRRSILVAPVVAASVVAGLVLLASAPCVLGATVEGLTCEYLERPLGIDVARPRLGWMIAGPGRGQRQTAYQVIVADSAEGLAADRGNLWDSGRVASPDSVQVEYAGKPLTSRTRCHWKVRVWDAQGQPSPWSAPAWWEMGLLDASDWKAQWVGRNWPAAASVAAGATGSASVLTGAQWIWYPEGNPAQAAPVGTRYFRRVLRLPAGCQVRRATAYATADNQVALFANGQPRGGGGDFHAASVIDVTRDLRPGENTLALAATNVGEAPNPAGAVAKVLIEFNQGEPMVVATDGSWRAADTAPAGWEKPGFSDAHWKPAQVLGPAGMAPWGEISIAQEDRRLPAPLLRREFEVSKDVHQARVYICGLGYYELHLNGNKQGDRVLDPALSDYDQRVYYVTYDVTAGLVRGRNAVGVMLGNGRFYGPRQRVPTLTRVFGYPRLLLQLEIVYADGSVERIASDGRWKVTTEGPIRTDNDYDGEEYDARREMPGWDRAEFDDSSWSAADRLPGPAGRLAAQMIPPMRITERLRPSGLAEPQPGVWVFDMKQNMVGWCRLRVCGPRGTQVQLRHAETLGPDGMLYVENLRSARAADTYVLKGQGVEDYQPRFTYHGFRYVEVRGLPGKPDLGSTLEGCVVHTDLERTGLLVTSHPLVNRIYRNIVWGARGNYLSIPTDCPQRDERQGWQGDRAAESQGESYSLRVVPLYAKWMQDIRDSQKPDGNLSDVCPNYWPLYSGNVTWPSAYLIIPGMLYRQYGDRRVIGQQWEGMNKWLDLMYSAVKDGITDRDAYGDWCVPPEDPKLIHSNDPSRKTPGPLLATAYLYHDLRLAAGYARILGKPGEARRLDARAETLGAAFNRRFFDAQARRYGNGSQTSQVLPLAFGLASNRDRRAVFGCLVDSIQGRCRGHIGTGLIGGQWLMQVLTSSGRPDLAWRLATNRDYPSWGYMVEHGATTIWELWNGNTADPAMNSHNHVMLVGDLATWLYEDLAGIRADPEQPGFRHVVMRPQPVAGLTFCKASYRTLYGTVESDWKREAGEFRWKIAIPANATANAYVPTSEPGTVREGEGPAATSPGVTPAGTEDGRAVYRLDSGSYEFAAPIK
jgi:alpha-L-rhamnosidase